MAVAVSAVGAEPTRDFAIPKQPRVTALLALGQQANVSVGLKTGARCVGSAQAVGKMTVRQALSRLLGGSGCEAVVVDPQTIIIVPRRGPPAPTTPIPTPLQTSTEPAQLSEVIVTAGKRPELASHAPSAITAISHELLATQGAVDVGGLSALTAGITVTNLGPGRDKILMRGLSDGPLTGHTQSTVGIYLDDLRLTYNAPDPDLRWTDVVQVEVLRGPQGSLYGAGSIGGVVRVVSNAPDPSSPSASITSTGSVSAPGAPSGSLEGFVNQPIGRNAAIRIAGWLESDGGYLENTQTGAKNANSTRRDGFRATAFWEATSELSLRATVVNQAINSPDAHYTDPSVGPLARRTAQSEPHDNDFRALDFSAEWRPAGFDLTANLGLIDHEVASRYDASLAPAVLIAGLSQPPAFVDDNHIRNLVGEGRIRSSASPSFSWILGVFGALGEQSLLSQVVGANAATGYVERRTDQLLEGALFGEATFAVTRRLSVTVGGRVFASREKVRSKQDLGPAADFSGRITETGFAPKLLAAYRATEEWSVYAQATEGYRSPGLNSGGGPGQSFSAPDGSEPRRTYGGDELWSFEGGLRYARKDGRVQVRAATFYAGWRDIQSDLILPSGLPFTANLGDGRTVGIEAEASFTARRFSVALNGILEDPELDRPDPGFPLRPDAALAGVPNRSFGLSAGYVVPLAGGVLSLSARGNYIGPSRLTFDALIFPKMGDYVDSRLAVRFRRGVLDLTVFIDNVLDSRGDTFAYGNPFTIRSVLQATPQRPRTIGISVTRDF